MLHANAEQHGGLGAPALQSERSVFSSEFSRNTTLLSHLADVAPPPPASPPPSIPSTPPSSIRLHFRLTYEGGRGDEMAFSARQQRKQVMETEESGRRTEGRC